MSKQLDWPRYSRWTWIIAILALLALLWMWMTGRGPSAACCGAPSVATTIPAAAPAPVATVVAPVLAALEHKAIWEGGKLTVEGVVADEATKKSMLDAAVAKYGAANVVDKLTVDASAKGRPLKLALIGDVANDAIKAQRGAEAQAMYANATIENQLVVSVPAPASTAQGVQCGDKVALAVNFATGSARLTPESSKLLNAVIPCIQGPYEVGGHTDNVGKPAANQALSERRSKTVAAYLTGKGVDAKLLTAKGYGDTTPIGDNATAEGKAKNRRIEFKKM